MRRAGIRLIHSKPYSPERRGKQERLNRYIREAFLAEAIHQGIESLEELNDLFAAWAEQVANRRVHAETGQAPIERFGAGGPHRQASPALIGEAFRWSVTRRVTGAATVPLEGNAYAVDPALRPAGRAALRPEDLTRIEVYLDGARRRRGAVRHPPARPPRRAPAPRPGPDPTGIDYLGMVAAAHDGEAGTGAKIDFTQLGKLPGSPRPEEEQGSPAPWAAHFGLARTPFGKSIPARDLFPARPTPRRSPGSASAWTNPARRDHGDVGAGKTVSVRTVLAGLDASRHTIIYLPNPMIGIRGLHEMIVATSAASPTALLPAHRPGQRHPRRRA